MEKENGFIIVEIIRAKKNSLLGPIPEPSVLSAMNALSKMAKELINGVDRNSAVENAVRHFQKSTPSDINAFQPIASEVCDGILKKLPTSQFHAGMISMII